MPKRKKATKGKAEKNKLFSETMRFPTTQSVGGTNKTKIGSGPMSRMAKRKKR